MSKYNPLEYVLAVRTTNDIPRRGRWLLQSEHVRHMRTSVFASNRLFTVIHTPGEIEEESNETRIRRQKESHKLEISDKTRSVDCIPILKQTGMCMANV
jgi:hypothetical protein